MVRKKNSMLRLRCWTTICRLLWFAFGRLGDGLEHNTLHIPPPLMEFPCSLIQSINRDGTVKMSRGLSYKCTATYKRMAFLQHTTLLYYVVQSMACYHSVCLLNRYIFHVIQTVCEYIMYVVEIATRLSTFVKIFIVWTSELCNTFINFTTY